MRDAMVYAEINLYLVLQDKFSQRSYLGGDGACEELAAWKSRWNYLIGEYKSDTQTVRLEHTSLSPLGAIGIVLLDSGQVIDVCLPRTACSFDAEDQPLHRVAHSGTSVPRG